MGHGSHLAQGALHNLKLEIHSLSSPESCKNPRAIPEFAQRITRTHIASLGGPDLAPYTLLAEFESVFRSPDTPSGLRKCVFFTFNELCSQIRRASGCRNSLEAVLAI